MNLHRVGEDLRQEIKKMKGSIRDLILYAQQVERDVDTLLEFLPLLAGPRVRKGGPQIPTTPEKREEASNRMKKYWDDKRKREKLLIDSAKGGANKSVH
jgi:hypothetical protein